MPMLADRYGSQIKINGDVSFEERSVCGHKASRGVVKGIYHKAIAHKPGRKKNRAVDTSENYDLEKDEKIVIEAGSLMVEVKCEDGVTRSFMIQATEVEAKGT